MTKKNNHCLMRWFLLFTLVPMSALTQTMPEKGTSISAYMHLCTHAASSMARTRSAQRVRRAVAKVLIFILYITVPIISYSCVPSYGLFGELKSLVVVSENKEEIVEVSSKATVQRKQKGINIFNLWLFVLAYITCLQLLAHSMKVPKADTIVAKKVRMNN